MTTPSCVVSEWQAVELFFIDMRVKVKVFVSYTLHSESIMIPSRFSRFVMLQPFPKII